MTSLVRTDMEPLRVSAFVSSLRRGSVNRRLLDAVVAATGDHERVEVDVIDLRRYPLPIYDGDAHERDGIPLAAHEIHDRIAATDAVLVANPEYNGGYPALFKNTVDWVSRIDMLVFHPRYVGLLAATPGKKGGVRGLEHTRFLFENMFVTTHPEALSVPHAADAIDEDGSVAGELADRLRSWTASFVDAAREHAATRDAAVA